jgi:hypothetical protein
MKMKRMKTELPRKHLVIMMLFIITAPLAFAKTQPNVIFIMADTFGFDKGCSTRAAHWAKLHGRYMVDALTGKPTPGRLESYHKGAFFKNALMCYLIRRLHHSKQLPSVRTLSDERKR